MCFVLFCFALLCAPNSRDLWNYLPHAVKTRQLFAEQSEVCQLPLHEEKTREISAAHSENVFSVCCNK